MAKNKDDINQLQTKLEQLSNLQKYFDNFKQHSGKRDEQRAMGCLIQTWPEEEYMVRGVTTLDNHLVVLYDRTSNQIAVYDIDSA